MIVTVMYNPQRREAYSLALQSQTFTMNWVTNFIKYVDDTYEDLLASKFTAEQAWSLTTRLMKRVLDDVALDRSTFKAGVQSLNEDTRCSSVLMGIFRALDVMQEYQDHKFRDHPSISSEYVKFLATNSGHDAMEKQKEQLDAYKKEIISLKSDLTKAQTAAATAQRKADTVGNSVDGLRKELAALKKKPGA